MKNYLKKTFAISLSLVMVFVSTSISFAATERMSQPLTYDEQDIKVENIFANELDALSKEPLVKVKKVDGSTEYFYSLQDGTNGQAIEKEKINGDKVYHFKEGDLENTVTYKTDGTIWLDGKKVNISLNQNSTSVMETKQEQGENVRGRHYNVTDYVDSAPSGTTSSDYTTFVLEDEINVDFQKAVKSIAVGAIVSILTSGILALANAGYIAGTIVSLATGFAAGVATSLKTGHPLSVGSKIELYRRQHKNGYQISRSSAGESRFVYKDRLKYYAEKSNGEYVLFETTYKYRLTRILS